MQWEVSYGRWSVTFCGTRCYAILTSLLFDLQTSVRGHNGVEFYQESNEHVVFFLALLLAKIANERLKILTSLLFDLKTSVKGQNGVEFYQESTWKY